MRNIFLLSVLALAACQSVSDVVPAGKDTYIVGANSHGGFKSDAEVTAMSIHRANDFCAGLGKQVEVLNTQNSGTQLWTPQQSQVTFKCVDK